MSVKILAVDNERVTIRVVTHALKSLGIETVGAADPDEALELARNNRFDLAIIDINLPGMDGFELVAQLKALPAMADIPVIIFTARSIEDDQVHAASAGAVGFLYKPFSTQELRNLVTKHLPTT
jgi:CheY-like chemotaxis protein